MTEPDFTREEFLAWARARPANEEYDYVVGTSCPIAQFLMDTGRADRPLVEPLGWREMAGGTRHSAPSWANDAACGVRRRHLEAGLRGDTFGRLVRRLEHDMELASC